MATTGNDGNKLPDSGGVFATTHWSVVLAAKTGGSLRADDAMEKLCRTYWPPLYAYIRREGHDATEAQDLTQEFFARLLAKDYLQHLRHQEGKFRSFLLTLLKHFLSDERDKAGAQKRGGGKLQISLDAYEAEEREALTPVDGLTAEQIYERRWAQAVMDAAVKRLEEEYQVRGNTALFAQLKDLQPGERGEKRYADIAVLLGLTEQAIKNAAHTFRRRYAELIREEIAETVSDPGEIEAEVKHLKQVFAN